MELSRSCWGSQLSVCSRVCAVCSCVEDFSPTFNIANENVLGHESCTKLHRCGSRFLEVFLVCNRPSCVCSWLSALESTRWLQHLSVMLKASTLVCSAMEREGRPVLVHCSDGWDRTPQIVALAKILLDPYYRTLEVSPPGLRVLGDFFFLDCVNHQIFSTVLRVSRCWWRRSGWTLVISSGTAVATRRALTM